MPAYIKPPDIFDAVLAAQGHLFGRQRGPQELDKATGSVYPTLREDEQKARQQCVLCSAWHYAALTARAGSGCRPRSAGLSKK